MTNRSLTSAYYIPERTKVLTSMALLSANRDVVRKLNTEGHTAVQIITKFTELSAEQQEKVLSPQELVLWLNDIFGLELEHTARILVVLRHEEFRKIVHKYCLTRYGEKLFAWSTIQNIISSKLDEIWIREFTRFFTFASKVFEDNYSLVSYDDWAKILEIEHGRPEYPLCLLFFPERDDYWEGKRKQKARWPRPPDYQEKIELPKLSKPFISKGKELGTRRPNFLVELKEDAYIKVWQNLCDNQTLVCPKWHDWYLLEKNVSSKLKFILRHVMAWIKPSWKHPERASKNLKDFLWRSEIQKIMFEESVLSDGQTRPYPPDANTKSMSWDLLSEMWDEVENENIWRDPSLAHMLAPPPSELSDPDQDAEAKQVVTKYMERFSYAHWARLVKLVVGKAGACLSGPLSCFNDPKKLEEVFAPHSPLGEVTCNSNFWDNKLLQKTPSLNNAAVKARLASEGEIFGALFQYAELKKIMLNTLEWGWKQLGARQIHYQSGSKVWRNTRMPSTFCRNVQLFC